MGIPLCIATAKPSLANIRAHFWTGFPSDSFKYLEGRHYPNYANVHTFGHLPFVDCLNKATEDGTYDIALLGAPFDTGSPPGQELGMAHSGSALLRNA